MKPVTESPNQKPVDEAMSAAISANKQVTAKNNALSQRINSTTNGATKRKSTIVTASAKDKWTRKRKTNKVQNQIVPIPKKGSRKKLEKLQQRKTQLRHPYNEF